MDATRQGILTLLKSAITAQALPLPEGFDLEAAMPLVRRHHMFALVYDGAVRCGIPAQLPVMQKLFQSYCRAMQISEGQMAQFHRICQSFDDSQIDYMPLKGCRMKGLYPKPELRMMGDADILIRVEQYKQIRPVMTALGFQETKESDHEWVWDHPGLHTELHKRLMPTDNQDFYAYFGEGWQLAKVKDGVRYAMTAEDEWVFLFTHFVKHYRGGGIGCRHVVDLWVYRRANPGLDESYVEAVLEKLHLLEFYKNILRLIDFWFCDGAADTKLEFLTEHIFAAGSWGHMRDHIVAESLRDSKKWKTGSKLAYLRRRLFPSVESVRGTYRILYKAPWLLPLVWIIRPFHKVLFEGKSLKQQKENLKLLDKKSLQEQQRMLEYVGLEYHF